MMKKLIVLILIIGLAFCDSGYIINNANVVTNVDASSASKVYVDSLGPNPDLGLRLCDPIHGQKYVAAVYSINASGTLVYSAISWNLTTGSPNTLVYSSNAGGGPGCFYTPIDAYAFSQFRDSTRTPPVFVSAFPGRIHILYSDSVTGTSPTLVQVPVANGYLRGSYSCPGPAYNQVTRTVSGDVSSITFQTDVGALTKTPADADWGLNAATGRSMVMGLCTDDFGDVCSDGVIVNSSAQLPRQLSVGAITVDDQNVYTRNLVVDGTGCGSLCIGTNLVPGVSAVPNSINTGGTSTITVTVTNSGNVNVTTPFRMTLNITGPSGYFEQRNFTVSQVLTPCSRNTTTTFIFTNTSKSGTYTFRVEADPLHQVVECDEGNIVSANLNVAKVYTLHVLIDGIENTTFAYAGRPYNVSVYVNDSDGNIVNSANFVFTETNGLNPFTPTQVWNNSGTLYGVTSTVVGAIPSNASGIATLAVLPTCNRLYNDPVKGPILVSKIGNYAMTVRGYGAGFDLTVPLNVTDSTCADPGWVNNKEIVNKDYVKPVYDWLYTMFAVLKKLIVP